MKVKDFAKQTGYHERHIRKLIKTGEIEAVKRTALTPGGRFWDIDPAYVPIVRERKPGDLKQVIEKPKPKQSLRRAVRELIAYNKKHGTDYSYGYAVVKGII